MDREEAIEELKTRYLTMSQCLDKEELHKANKAIDMAIEALQQESQFYPLCEDCNKKMDEIRRVYDKCKEQQPYEDAISRQDALDVISRIGLCKCSTNEVQAVDECLRAVKYLPSVNTEKVGEWIPIDPEQHLFQCSVCGSESTVDTVMYKPTWKYCPNCKAKMEGEE